MLIYFLITDRDFGKGYHVTCFEPGCVIVKDSYIQINGQVVAVNFDRKYIVGKVGKPNAWLIEHDNGGDPEGYFIVNKDQGGRQVGLTKSQFEQACTELDITSCDLYKYGIFSIMYNPFYLWKFIRI